MTVMMLLVMTMMPAAVKQRRTVQTLDRNSHAAIRNRCCCCADDGRVECHRRLCSKSVDDDGDEDRSEDGRAVGDDAGTRQEGVCGRIRSSGNHNPLFGNPRCACGGWRKAPLQQEDSRSVSGRTLLLQRQKKRKTGRFCSKGRSPNQMVRGGPVPLSPHEDPSPDPEGHGHGGRSDGGRTALDAFCDRMTLERDDWMRDTVNCCSVGPVSGWKCPRQASGFQSQFSVDSRIAEGWEERGAGEAVCQASSVDFPHRPWRRREDADDSCYCSS